jgi:predicted NBD/HSP70 family sugar kinase
LNELAFAPVDYNPMAPIDEWSGDAGLGVQYFSQQAVGRLIPDAGIVIDDIPIDDLPNRLCRVQELAAEGNESALSIYRTIGTYLGYTLAHYADFYKPLNCVEVLGRVTTGYGGKLILEKAREVLDHEFPELAQNLSFYEPSEREKRHGQAAAAAHLPQTE